MDEVVVKPKRTKNTILGGETMPKGQRTPTDAKSVYIKFTEAEDLDLLASLEAEAKCARRDLPTYILLTMLVSRKVMAPTAE